MSADPGRSGTRRLVVALLLGALTYVVVLALVGWGLTVAGAGAGRTGVYSLLFVVPPAVAAVVTTRTAPERARTGARSGAILAAGLVVLPAVLHVLSLLGVPGERPWSAYVAPVLVPLVVLLGVGALTGRMSAAAASAASSSGSWVDD